MVVESLTRSRIKVIRGGGKIANVGGCYLYVILHGVAGVGNIGIKERGRRVNY